MYQKTIVLKDKDDALAFVNGTERCVFPVNLRRPGDISEYNGKSILNMMIIVGCKVVVDYHEADAAVMEPLIARFSTEKEESGREDYTVKSNLDDELLTGNVEIDTQHKNLILFINYLADACENNNLSQARIILRRLRDYANMHFDTELRFMIDAGFSTVDIHTAQHQALLREINRMQRRIDDNTADLTGQAPYIRKEVCDVFTNHIRRYDLEMCRFLQDRLDRLRS